MEREDRHVEEEINKIERNMLEMQKKYVYTTWYKFYLILFSR